MFATDANRSIECWPHVELRHQKNKLLINHSNCTIIHLDSVSAGLNCDGTYAIMSLVPIWMQKSQMAVARSRSCCDLVPLNLLICAIAVVLSQITWMVLPCMAGR